MVKVGVVLAGCGYLDGAEIHEAVLTAYFLGLEGAEVSFCAPDVDQMHVVDHRAGEPTDETRYGSRMIPCLLAASPKRPRAGSNHPSTPGNPIVCPPTWRC